MPRHIQADGRDIVVPDDATPDEINQIVGPPPSEHVAGMLPGSAPPTPAAHPAVSMQPGDIGDEFQSYIAHPEARGGKRTIASRVVSGMTAPAIGLATHPVRSIEGAVKAMDYSPQAAAEQAASDPGLPEDIGGAITGVAMGEGAGMLAEPIAAGLNATGRGLKSAGALSSRIGVGAPSAAANMGADAGAALSENRIVGTGAKPGVLGKGLTAKVQATIPEAMEARDAVLAKSPVGPNVDVTSGINEPFNQITADKLNPRTGAVRPKAHQSMLTAQRAINEVQDPQTGLPTGDPKPLDSLTPLEVGQLNKNVYGMADYSTPDSDLANQAVKGAGKSLKDKLDEVAPEASTQTQNAHNLLGAEDLLKSQGQGAKGAALPTTLTDLVLHATKAAKTGVGTTLGAGLDVAGTGMMRAGGAIRSLTSGVSPVAPERPPSSSVPPQPGPQRMLPADVPANADTSGLPSEPPLQPAQRESFTTPAPARPRGYLGAEAGPVGEPGTPPVGNLHPGTPNPATARTRITPNPRTLNQQVMEDQPGYISPKGTRRLIVGPGGGVKPEPYTIESPMTKITGPADRATSLRNRVAPMNIDPDEVGEGDYSLTHPVKAYHGTSPEAATSIDKEGLKSGDEGYPVFLTPKKSLAEQFAQHRSEGKPGVVYSTTLPKKSVVGSGTGGYKDDIEVRGELSPAKLNKLASRVAPSSPSGPDSMPNITKKAEGGGTFTYSARFPDKGLAEAYIEPTDRGYAMRTVGVPNNQLGKGYGKALYEHVIDDAHKQGKILTSDDDPDGFTNAGAQRVWDSLVKSGKAIKGKDGIYQSVPPPAPARLPAPSDIDGWEALVDQGKARYNTRTHSYDYIAPAPAKARTSLSSKVTPK